MKVLLFGRTGQVGRELQQRLMSYTDLVALDRHSDNLCGDLTNLEGIAETIRVVRPDVIINAAAYTAVDKAETDRDVARLINAAVLRIMSQEANKCGAWLVHYSTDYVFDGTGTTPWRETDTPHPINFYGVTKLEGEQGIEASCSRYIIFRTSWVYAAHGKNFIQTILQLAKTKDSLSIINDQIGAPTGAALIADVTVSAIAQAMGNTGSSGIYNLAAQGAASWFDYARYIVQEAQALGIKLQTPLDKIAPITTSQYPTPAHRPQNSRLDTTKLRETFGVQLPDWKIGVASALKELALKQ